MAIGPRPPLLCRLPGWLLVGIDIAARGAPTVAGTGVHRIAGGFADGQALLAPSITRRLIAEFAARPDHARPAPRELDGVTAREREVLCLVARGLSNVEIGAQLYLSVATVKTHVSRLLTKLAARDRAQLVIAAYESGLVRAAR